MSPFTLPVRLDPHSLLRPLTGEDAALLGPACAAMDPWRRLGVTAAGLTAYLNREDGALRRLTLVVEGRPAGLLAVRMPWLRGPFVEALAVLPDFQGRGRGEAMVAWLARETAAVSANLWASVSDFNTAGRRFWRDRGFEEIAPLPDLVRPGSSEILLRRRLP